MTVLEKLRSISPHELALLGVANLAYIRCVERKGDNQLNAYVIHAADGTTIAVMEDLATALATIKQNDLEALSLH